MRILRKIISLVIVGSFVVTSCVQATPVSAQDSHLRPASLANTPQSDLASTIKSNSAGQVPGPEEIKSRLKKAGFEELLKPKRKDELRYFIRAYQRFFEKSVLLVIGAETEEGKIRGFIPSARMLKEEDRRKLGIVNYSDLSKGAEKKNYANEAKKAFLILNGLDGGLGKNVDRGSYLDKRYEEAVKAKKKGKDIDPAILKRSKDKESGHIELGAKGVDTVRMIKIKDRKGRIILERKASIAEIKLSRLIKELDRGDYREGNVIYQPLISADSKQSYVDLMKLKCILPGHKRQSYGKILTEKGVIKSITDYENKVLEEFNTGLLPLVDPDTKNLLPKSKHKGAPGGHGQLGMIFLLRALDIAKALKDPEFVKKRQDIKEDVERINAGIPLIRIFYNGDGVSNMSDPTIIGWMVKNKVPIIIITTTKAGIDRKGGEFGEEKLPGGKSRAQILELKQAQNVDKERPGYKQQYDKTHEQTFYDEGLIGKGKKKQIFNTNAALINYSVLAEILKKLLDKGLTEEEIIKYMTPDPIKNQKEVKGKVYLSADSALASALLNLSALFDENDIAGDVLREVTKPDENKEGLEKLVSLVNANYKERSQFFTPFKKSYDFWFQVYTNYYELDTENWILEDDDRFSQQGPPILAFTSNKNPKGEPKGKGDLDYYDNIMNLIKSLGNKAQVKGLRMLNIDGLVKLPNSVLKGNVVIINEGENMIDLYRSKKIKNKLLREKLVSLSLEGRLKGRLIFENVIIIIRADNREIIIRKLKPNENIELAILREKMKLFGVEPRIANKLIKRLQQRKLKLYKEDLEVLNKNGKVMGKLNRKLVHETGLLHRTANAFVFSPDGKVLLGRRRHNTKIEPLRLSIYGGHVVVGETYETTIINELKDELRLSNLRGHLYRMGREGEFGYEDPKGKNNERRTLYVYILGEAEGETEGETETEQIVKTIESFEKQKAKQTREGFEEYLEQEQEKKSGLGEIYGRFFISLQPLINSDKNEGGRYIEVKEPFKDEVKTEPEQVNLTSDLLEPLLDNPDIVKAMQVFTLPNWEEQVENNPEYTEIDIKSSSARDKGLGAKDVNANVERCIDDLIRDVEDYRSGLFVAEAEALVKIGKPAVPFLIKALGHRNERVRECVVKTIAAIGTDAASAVPALITVIKSGDIDFVYHEAIEAFNKVAPAEEAIPDLIVALGDKSLTVNSHARSALVKIGKPAVPFLIKASEDRNENVRKSATEALGKIGPVAKDAIPALEKASKSRIYSFRKAALEALAKIKNSGDSADSRIKSSSAGEELQGRKVEFVRWEATATVETIVDVFQGQVFTETEDEIVKSGWVIRGSAEEKAFLAGENIIDSNWKHIVKMSNPRIVDTTPDCPTPSDDGAKFSSAGTLDKASKLFREGEKIWREAKDCPDASQVENLANEAIKKFKEAREILTRLRFTGDEGVKKLLKLIEGDKPGGKGGRIGRASKTIKGSKEVVDLYNENGTLKSSVELPTCQYLHADPKGLIHATVGLFIFTPEGDIVFQKRASNKVLFPSMLTLAACGHVPLGRSVLEALDKEVEEETGIQNISKRDITPIGDPEIVKKEPRIYDQRIDLIAYEFTATTQEEAEALRRISAKINKEEKRASRSVFDRIISNYNEDIWTLTLYTFGWDKKDEIAKKAGEATEETGVPIGDANYNREVKALYAHVATEEDMEIISGRKTKDKDEEVDKFETDSRSIGEIAKDFKNNPEKYPDTFIPTFTDPVVVRQLADIQQEKREAWVDALPENLLSHRFSQKDVDNLYSSTLAAYMNLLAEEGKRIPGVLKDLVMQHYKEEQQKVLLADKDYAVGANNDKYDQEAKAVPFEGITTVSNIPESHRLSIIFRDIVGKIEDWQKKNLLTESKKPILATVAVGSEHITIFDLICQDEGAQKNGDWYKKYNDELNQKTKEEINKLTAQRTADKGLSAVEEKEIKKQVSYEVIAREVFKALKSFEAEKRPVFKPLGIAAFPPEYATSTKSVLILSMAPASAEDLAIVVKMQKAIEEATGISNSGIAPFKGHISLGYFINNKGSKGNPITPEDLNKFKEFVNSLDEMVRGESDNVRCFLKMPSIELSYFKDMDAFPSIATFSWKDKEYNGSQEVNVLERMHQLQKSTMPETTAAFSAITGEVSEDVKVANHDKYLEHMENRWKDFERVKSKEEGYKTRSEITQKGIQSSLLKFDANGNVLPFLGYSSVTMLPKSNPLYLRLAVLQEDLEDELEAEGLDGRIGYVTPESFHMTFCDLVVEGKGEQAGKIDLSAERKKELEDAFDRTFRNLKGFYSTKWEAKGIGTFRCSLLLVRMFPQNKDDLAMAEGARETQLENSGKKHKSFIGHMTLGYIVKPFNEGEYAKFLEVLQKYRNEHFGTFMMDHVQLSHFTDMNNFLAVREVQLAQKPSTKASSAGMLNLDDIASLTPQALDRAIASAKGDLAKVLVKSKFVGELFKIEAAGTIVIDDESLPLNQKEVISDIYNENSQALKELERLTGCVIRLRSQLNEDDITGQLIIISDQNKIPGYENARYLNIKNNIPKAADSYLPLVPLIGIARVLLTSDDIEYIRTTLNRDDFYRDIFGHPVTTQQIQNFLDTGIFELPVPKFDYEKVEQLQRQALAALIAA